jgi:predicted ATPase/DNA-binding SARP family transcriptional activator
MAHQRLESYAGSVVRREAVRVRLLGGFSLSLGRHDIEADRGRLKKAAGLVKLLALAPGHRMHKERIMEALWPGVDARHASNNLHRTLHSTRAVLVGAGANHLPLRRDFVELCPDVPLWVDVEAFEDAARAAFRSGEPAAFRAAISLYAGDLLPENPYEAWAQERREDLRRLFQDLLVGLGALYEERGEYERAIETLRTAVAQEPPTDEDAHVQLMRLYALSGRRLQALGQYERLRERLTQEFETLPTNSSRRLYEEIRAGREPHKLSPTRATPVPNNLPAPLTNFVGREREILGVARSLPMARLMPLTGTGGSGKTRLAVEVAREIVGAYEYGVWLVELALVSDPDLVARTVATPLGVREQTDLSQRRSAITSGSRRCCSCWTTASTSWTPPHGLRRISSAHAKGSRCSPPAGSPSVCPVRSSGPSRPSPCPNPAKAVPSKTLWSPSGTPLRRARTLALAGLRTDRGQRRRGASVCRELDGIPLSIELSTAKMGALAVEQLAERLEGSPKLLSGGDRTVDDRHRTLRATLDWSYELLGEPERVLFRRLSVFAGGWPLEAAEEVGADDGIEQGDVLDLLSRLVNKSMVVVGSVEGGAARYGMLESVRRYRQERLQASGEAEAAKRRHAALVLPAGRGGRAVAEGRAPRGLAQRLEEEYANLRAALGWALEKGEVDLGLWFGGALAEFWYMAGNLGEGRRWLQAALAKSAATPPTLSRIRALVRAG